MKSAKIKLRAERRAGELLKQMKANGALSSVESGRPGKGSNHTTLTDINITKDQSSQWQSLSTDLTESQFLETFETLKEKGEVPTAGMWRTWPSGSNRTKIRVAYFAGAKPIYPFFR